MARNVLVPTLKVTKEMIRRKKKLQWQLCIAHLYLYNENADTGCRYFGNKFKLLC